MEEGNVLGKRALDNTAVQEGPKRKKVKKFRRDCSLVCLLNRCVDFLHRAASRGLGLMKRYSVKQPTTYRMVIHCLVSISRVRVESPYFPRMRMRVGCSNFARACAMRIARLMVVMALCIFELSLSM